MSNYRRVVTGFDSNGRSCVVSDAPAARLVGPAGDPILIDFWQTATGEADPATKPIALAPVAGGSVFRFFRVQPESRTAQTDPATISAQTAAYYASVGAADSHVAGARHPGFHITETVDYIVVLEGEITLMLDEGETILRPFDVVVQRGTAHAWVNHTDTPTLLMAVLVDNRKGQSD